MTLELLKTLDEKELEIALYVVNGISPVIKNTVIPPIGLTWFKRGALEKRIVDAFDKVKPEFHSIYSSLLNKLGVEHVIKHETPTPPVSGSHVSGSI